MKQKSGPEKAPAEQVLKTIRRRTLWIGCKGKKARHEYLPFNIEVRGAHQTGQPYFFLCRSRAYGRNLPLMRTRCRVSEKLRQDLFRQTSLM